MLFIPLGLVFLPPSVLVKIRSQRNGFVFSTPTGNPFFRLQVDRLHPKIPPVKRAAFSSLLFKILLLNSTATMSIQLLN